MSVGCCGPFDGDEEDPDSDYDRLAIETDALRVENRLLMRAVIKSVTETLNKMMSKDHIVAPNAPGLNAQLYAVG